LTRSIDCCRRSVMVTHWQHVKRRRRLLRDVLSTRLRLPKAWVKTAGYWRRGKASTHEVYAHTNPEP